MKMATRKSDLHVTREQLRDAADMAFAKGLVIGVAAMVAMAWLAVVL